MEDIGFWEGILRDLSGKGQFRLFLQPAVALLLGFRVGLSDARQGAAPFAARLIACKHQRCKLIASSIRAVWMPLSLALVMDAVFQYLIWGRIRILAAIVVGILLVWLPFTIARGVTNRVVRR